MMWWSENSGYGMGWVSWILMALAMIAFWGLVIAALLALFSSQAQYPQRTPWYECAASVG